MLTNEISKKRLYILDTNVLIHDPSALFRFDEHDIYLPSVVLEELDNSKKGLSDVSRNARQVSRFLADMLSSCSSENIKFGISLESAPLGKNISGHIFFQTQDFESKSSFEDKKADNKILEVAIALGRVWTDYQIILVTKDINLRIKATISSIRSEDYYNDKVLNDSDFLYSGIQSFDTDFWEQFKKVESWQESDRISYRVVGQAIRSWTLNQGLLIADSAFIVREIEGDQAVIESLKNYGAKSKVWGINAKNAEQNFALNLLLDPTIDFVTLLGIAGTGKTLLALAAGLEQVFESKLYNEIIMTRATVSMGDDIGFLPGTEEEKMTPWMGALIDNFEILNPQQKTNAFAHSVTADLLNNRIKIKSLNFMRGRTFHNKYLIIDEAQNLTSRQMKSLITRSGSGTKVICLGNLSQIDTPYLTETTSGLSYAVGRMKNWKHGAHVILQRGERSRLADYANEHL